ncbi:uncharacterized protein LOC119689342 isoform X1 [Teleopsis dalmanni]|uniref:uncharacterized protein LOC119689342 isoform X1 n=1 Tax=Teleopsis dalmanni TaxID=139649 RepID=UPI0018CE70F6|nr:uncharacterized protein LOC119689342 isoform X1 [Teleopsis dalmanni]
MKRNELNTNRNKPIGAKIWVQTKLPFVPVGTFEGAAEATREMHKYGNESCNDVENLQNHQEQDQVDGDSADDTSNKLWPEDLHLILPSETETASDHELEGITNNPATCQEQDQTEVITQSPVKQEAISIGDDNWPYGSVILPSETETASDHELEGITNNPATCQEQDQTEVITQSPVKQEAISIGDYNWPYGSVILPSETETASDHELEGITNNPATCQEQEQTEVITQSPVKQEAISIGDDNWPYGSVILPSETETASDHELEGITNNPATCQEQEQVDETEVITQSPVKQEAISIGDDNWPYGSVTEVIKSLFSVKKDSCKRVKRRGPCIKFFYFYDDPQQSYYGTWSKRSSIISPRQPFAKDLEVCDYRYEFGYEWKEKALRKNEEELQYEDDAITIEAQNIAEDPKIGQNSKKMKGGILGCFWAVENGNKPDGCPQEIWDEFNKNAML